MKPAWMSAAVLIGASALTMACVPVEPMAPPVQDGPDQCNASAFQSYVGRPSSSLPPAPAGAIWRASCSTCAVTMDYNPSRMNIVYDDRTHIIQSIRCG
jgi:Peptidase inhibitor I78 family.